MERVVEEGSYNIVMTTCKESACKKKKKESACNIGDLGSIPGQEDSLEKGMATHSSTLAWRIPWTGEPGGLQSLGSQAVEHD